MHRALEESIPVASRKPIAELISMSKASIKVVSERKTRHGDYRKMPDGTHQITINGNLNPYRFLITLIHELAHLLAYKKYGPTIKPHGKEWKHTFQMLMLPFIRPEIFPAELLPPLALHFKNPKASSDTDARLSLALKGYDPPNDKNYIFEIPEGGLFRLYNGKVFRRGAKRVKRFECVELSSVRVYLFNPNLQSL